MPKYEFTVNGEGVDVDVPAEMPLLWVLRDKLRITGPKYGCGVGVCRACTCLMGDEEVQTCMVQVKDADGTEVTTIEGLADGDELHPKNRGVGQEIHPIALLQLATPLPWSVEAPPRWPRQRSSPWIRTTPQVG
ncbi:(2Fe-2S)-binding protein [Saccharopolyspora sp. 5N708]|uniref:(2Fe-2S)-binding protein n=1 Tax=Saccharopolyspora sp. 5N708 TaxID=3457424 RepID=UPI003FD5857C